jgi:hypothetical protein
MVYLTPLSEADYTALNCKSVDTELEMCLAGGGGDRGLNSRTIPACEWRATKKLRLPIETTIPVQMSETFMASEVHSNLKRLRA